MRNIDEPDVNSTDREYFFIHDDLIDKNISTIHNKDVSLDIIQNMLSLPKIDDSSNNLRK